MFFFLPYHTGSKRHQGQACQFKELSSERNSNNSDAPQQSNNQITERHFPSEENNPDQIDQNENTPFPYTTSLPNGQNASVANLKHCIPTGIPTMVIHQIHPAKIHDSPPSRPPKRNHRILPKNLIFFSFVCYRLKVIPNHCAVFHTPCSVFFIRHIRKIGLHYSGDSVMCNQNICFFL